jgi:hypothetical protein
MMNDADRCQRARAVEGHITDHAPVKGCFRLLSYQFEKDYEYTVSSIKKLAGQKVRAVKQAAPAKS